MALPVNFKDDVLASSMDGKRRYNMITNSDGTVSFEDVTTYSQEGSNFGSAQINNTNGAINTINNNVLDTIEQISANTSGGKFAGALALKNVNNSIGDISGFTNDTYDSLGSFIQYCVDNGYLPAVNVIPLIPKMTSNTTPSGTASSSSTTNPAYPAYKAFDRDDKTFCSINLPANSISNNYNYWIQYDFGKIVTVSKFLFKWQSIYNSNTSIITRIALRGSNDGSTWENISIENVSSVDAYYAITPSTYRYFRLCIIDANVSSYDMIGLLLLTIQFYGRY